MSAVGPRKVIAAGIRRIAPDDIEVLEIRRWPDGFSVSISAKGRISESSRRRYPSWQEALADTLAALAR